MLELGTKLKHPVHGVGEVVGVRATADRLVDGEFREGYEIHLQFDRLIRGVEWRKRVDGEFVSLLIFHSAYLNRLEVVTDGD